jgi:hypothetical protein
LELIKKLKKAREGSNYDWSSWFRKKAESRKLDMAFTVKEHEVVRKTHINACIEELNKKQQLDATEIYGLLCEMVHPNFGSNTLVIATREKLSDVAGNVVLSSHPKNLEAAAWFFEVGAAPLGKMFEKEVEYIERSNKIASFYKSTATGLGALQGLFTVNPKL